MTVRELINALLIETGEKKLGSIVAETLEDNEVGNLEVGVDISDECEIIYVESIANEFPTFISLKCE